MNIYVSVGILMPGIIFAFSRAALANVDRDIDYREAFHIGVCGVIGATAAYLVCNIAGLTP